MSYSSDDREPRPMIRMTDGAGFAWFEDSKPTEYTNPEADEMLLDNQADWLLVEDEEPEGESSGDERLDESPFA